jgi:hypothetical protein
VIVILMNLNVSNMDVIVATHGAGNDWLIQCCSRDDQSKGTDFRLLFVYYHDDPQVKFGERIQTPDRLHRQAFFIGRKGISVFDPRAGADVQPVDIPEVR